MTTHGTRVEMQATYEITYTGDITLPWDVTEHDIESIKVEQGKAIITMRNQDVYTEQLMPNPHRHADLDKAARYARIEITRRATTDISDLFKA